MILIFFFSLFWIYLVKTLVNFLFFKKKFKIMALINYTVWWILSLSIIGYFIMIYITLLYLLVYIHFNLIFTNYFFTT